MDRRTSLPAPASFKEKSCHINKRTSRRLARCLNIVLKYRAEAYYVEDLFTKILPFVNLLHNSRLIFAKKYISSRTLSVFLAQRGQSCSHKCNTIDLVCRVSHDLIFSIEF